MSQLSLICNIASLVIALILILWGLKEVLDTNCDRSDAGDCSHRLTRQVRGFGLMILGQFVLLLGANLCSILPK